MPGNKYIEIVDEVLYTKDMKVLLGCPMSVSDLSIPNGVRKLDERSFDFCRHLATLTIPATVQEFGDAVFIGCTGLKKITVQWATPPPMGANPFNGVPVAHVILSVPAGCKAAYEAYSVWAKFNIVENDNLPIAAGNETYPIAAKPANKRLQLLAIAVGALIVAISNFKLNTYRSSYA
jgi:hypothetical protein